MMLRIRGVSLSAPESVNSISSFRHGQDSGKHSESTMLQNFSIWIMREGHESLYVKAFPNFKCSCHSVLHGPQCMLWRAVLLFCLRPCLHSRRSQGRAVRCAAFIIRKALARLSEGGLAPQTAFAKVDPSTDHMVHWSGIWISFESSSL